MRTVTVLGAGSWGTALAVHLGRVGHSVRLWARDRALVAEMIVPPGERGTCRTSACRRTSAMTDSLAEALDLQRGTGGVGDSVAWLSGCHSVTAAARRSRQAP